MYYTYALLSVVTGKIYIGYSADLKKRIKTHLCKSVHTTKRMGQIKLIFYEAFVSKQDAIRREKYFKTTKGKRALKIMLKNTLGPVV